MENTTDDKKTKEMPINLKRKIPEISESGISQGVINELSDEINNMLSYAIFSGLIIITLIQNSNVDDLINTHNLFCKNIYPATPKSIDYTKKLYLDGKGKSAINKLPLVRNLILLAVFSYYLL